MIENIRNGLRSAVMGLIALAPAVLLARSESIAALVAGTAAVFGCAFACSAIVRALPDVARGYVSARLCSPRYLLPAAGLPLLSALALARFGLPALLAVGAHHVILAHRYRRRWTRPGALRVALLPAAIGGLFCALECLALRGREWHYGGRLLYAEESPLQRIVLVDRAGSLELFIDGELQFRSADERLYHDGLLAPALERLRTRARVLVLGGGDGLATRDLLRCPRVEHVTIVDWDRAVTRLFRSHAALRALNERALLDARVRVIHRDVRSVLAETGEAFDLVVGDLTDPNPSDARSIALYSAAFYGAIRARLKPHGVVVTHASSLDTWAEQAVPEALAAAGFTTSVYVRSVPSFESVTYVIGT